MKAIYQERGYRAKDIPRLILEKNLFGLEICDRSAQLAAFALMMKARADDRRIFSAGIQPHVLAIQESKGMDAREITEALNTPIFKGEAPPPESLFEEIDDEKTPLFSRKNLSEPGQMPLSDLAQLIDLFEHGKTFGSLIQVPEKLLTKLPALAERVEAVLAHGGMFEKAAAKSLGPLVEQTRVLTHGYDTVVTNPPYMGSRAMNAVLKRLAQTRYRGSKTDTFAVFIERCLSLLQEDGHLGLVVPYVWMFISSYEELRDKLEDEAFLTSLIQLEYNAFEPACVPVCTFALVKTRCSKYVASYIRLTDFRGHQNQAPKTIEAIRNPHCGWRFEASLGDFQKIPGSPFAYWLTPAIFDLFGKGRLIGNLTASAGKNVTGDNDRFQRMHWEVDNNTIGFDRRWVPIAKGGGFRKWSGSLATVVDWSEEAREHYDSASAACVIASRFWRRPGITWGLITSLRPSFRLKDERSTYSDVCIFPEDETDLLFLLGLLNSCVAVEIIQVLNPTLNFPLQNIQSVPVPRDTSRSEVVEVVREMLEIAGEDNTVWENRAAFTSFPLLRQGIKAPTVLSSWHSWKDRCGEQITRMQALEERNNRLFIEAFGLKDGMSPAVAEDQITLARPELEQDVKNLVSYAVGCMMGRYSLDKPGPAYAYRGNQGFDSSQYKTFPADQDGIIPVTDTAWFDDDAANRLLQFVGVAWPEEHLEENVTVIAESLGCKKGESPRDAIRRYLNQGFFRDHLQMYKGSKHPPRPIYWLFSSGKQKAFECLVYLHRYNEGTLGRMRTEYVIPLQGKIDARIDQLADDIPAATSTSHRKRLEKERDKLRKQQVELQTFDEKLRHYADQRISLDLDDGVKVNYDKFGDLLAEVKAVTGKKAE